MPARAAPRPNPQFSEELRAALVHPLDFPPLEQAVIPGDRVVMALDRDTPRAAALVAATWDILEKRHIAPENVLIIQPFARGEQQEQPDPRSELPEQVRPRVSWKIHDPTSRANCGYLAATASGERIYLAREVVDADVVVPIGRTSYDPLLGYRGTNSVFYPGLSTSEAVERALGQGHNELGPDDDRPLRQLIDEIGWLLGTQFSIQVIPAAQGGVSHVVAGAGESVFRRGKQLLAERWLVQLDSRPEIVIAAIDCDTGGHGWEQVGAALTTARNLVARGGKILVLSELDAELGRGMELIRDSDNPRDAIKPLRTATPPDLLAATQLAGAADWADVYLLSRLDSDLVEDLFLIPLENETEAARVLVGEESCLFLDSAQHTYGQVRRGKPADQLSP